MIKVGIQGERGSACDAVAQQLIESPNAELKYLSNADSVLANLKARKIDLAVLASESPLGIPVLDTQEAIDKHGTVKELRRLESKVCHVLLVRPEIEQQDVTFVASHPIPLSKHKETLSEYFPGYFEVQYIDTGVAAKDLASGILPVNTAVIAMRHAAEVFGLKVIDLDLPANDNYLTRFVLVE
jgi:prephenate dehydratase